MSIKICFDWNKDAGELYHLLQIAHEEKGVKVALFHAKNCNVRHIEDYEDPDKILTLM